ncbi:phospho-sugar mutase [Demequina zhanjiangensis]|uniref:Phospho-sugar mutase n=1 Tax=Demequina zhanjiangensis TaxID=3051659 RepID=A0ABT8G111_9MICO|nr:phospho-sugar mutase [Demequina sp. SYSU T00b26]MDN4472831.1 phospho-sugar mutase [Demequina sp. SYSU T00b26]
MDAALLETAKAWLDDDPDPVTRGELEAVIATAEMGDDAAQVDLADRFRGMLQFGTAGLRGAIGAGPNRMNRAVVIRAAAGLAAFLKEELGDAPARVAIGYDARHGSEQFAKDTAAVMTAAGHEALLLPRLLPTPVLAYATRVLDADAGVMVTASHNPPQDNGYKVYLGGRVVTDSGQGAQIVPPYDAKIAARIAAVETVESVERAVEGWTVLGEDVVDQYVAAAGAVAGAPEGDVADARANLRIVLTPLHGVGAQTVERALRTAGFTDLHTVPEQEKPDPDFPTVSFPNPEEKGAIDLALALAESVDADVVIANDPDTDRAAVATIIDGRWTMLHGDVVGSLLGERISSRGGHPEGAVVGNSVVSSQQLSAIAERYGLGYRHTLTGFKWISREEGLVYGYEEALGYCVAPDMVRDKDGISAAVVMADYVAELKAAGRTLADAIDDLARAYGVYLTRQVSARFADIALIGETMDRLLSAPPASLGGSDVVATDDMGEGFQGLPPTTGLHLATASGARVIIRPSGTEPKVKAYLEVIEPLGEDGDVRAARERATAAMDALDSDVHGALGL